jgi:hypothetical protein
VLARAAPAERCSCSLKRIPAAAIRAEARSLKPHPEFTLEKASSLKYTWLGDLSRSRRAAGLVYWRRRIDSLPLRHREQERARR